MNANRPSGLIAATATPLHDDFSPDTARLLPHCRWLLSNGCHGINLLGTTGEATSFSVEQRLSVMRAVAESDLPLGRFMVGTGASAWQDAVTLTRAAVDLGYAGALLLPPFFFPGISGDDLLDYVGRLIDAVADSRLRLYLYHIPQNTKVPWPVETVAELKRQHGDAIAGLKDSAGDLAYARAVAAAVPGFDVFPSAEASIANAVADGFAGCISASLNLTSPFARTAWDAPHSVAGTQALAAANELRALLSRQSLVPAVKSALAVQHGDAAWARICPPLRPMAAADAKALQAAMASVTSAAAATAAAA